MSTGRRGLRPAGSDTREAILQATRERLAEASYERRTMRGVGSAAGVDPRLVLHYFGLKRELFVASIRLAVDPPTFIARIFGGEPGQLPELRATLLTTQFVGLAMARYVVRIEPLASAPAEHIVAAMNPVIDHYLSGDWAKVGASGIRGRRTPSRCRRSPSPRGTARHVWSACSRAQGSH